MQKEGILYLNKDGIVACMRRQEDKILYKYNAIVLPKQYHTEILFRSHDQMDHQEMMKYNSTQHSTTGISPHMMLTASTQKAFAFDFILPRVRRNENITTILCKGYD